MLNELKSEIEKALRRYCKEPSHQDTAIKVLCRKGFALHPDSSCRAGMMVLEICHSIAGENLPKALQAATAVELIMEAGFMFDNVADDEIDSSGLTPPEELSLAITALCCGVGIANEAASSIRSHSMAFKAVVQLQINTIAACAGQFLDAYLQKTKGASVEQSLNMTCLKSGSIGRLVGEFGASMASDDEELIGLFGDLGYNVFTYLQLIDDLRDAFPSNSPSADLIQNKKTLPLVFFYNSLEQSNVDVSSDIISQSSEDSNQELRKIYQSSGSTCFCAIVAEVYLNRAKSSLMEIRHKQTRVDGLERLVSALEIAPQQFSLVS